MCVCSGNHSDSKPRSSASRAMSCGGGGAGGGGGDGRSGGGPGCACARGTTATQSRAPRRAARCPAAAACRASGRSSGRSPSWKPTGMVSIEDRDGVAVLTADRPPVNAMNIEFLHAVVGALDQVAADVPRAVVLAGLPGVFSAGADLKAVPGYGPAEQREGVVGINRMAL